MDKIELKMPRLGVNDDFVTLTEWLVEDHAYVTKGTDVAVIETSKETSELKAPADGYLHQAVQRDANVKVDALAGVITEEASFEFQKEEDAAAAYKITDKARALAEANGVDLSLLSHLKLIREKDVQALIRNDDEIVRSKANDVIIVCGGGLSKMAIDLLQHNKAYNIHGLVDDRQKTEADTLGVPYLGVIDSLRDLRAEGYQTAVNAYGGIGIDPTSKAYNLRREFFERIKTEGFFLPTLIHPTAAIAVSARLGEGTLVFEHVAIGPDAQIGDDCIINTGAIVSHDCKIGSHSRISPGAVLAGDVTVGENSLIGMGVTVYLGVHIGKNVIISNGQTVLGDVPDNTVIK